MTTPEIIDQIHELILEDRRFSTKTLTEQLGISLERVGSIIHEDLDMRKLSAKWVPKYLNVDQKHQRCQSSEQILEFFRPDPNDFVSRLLTMDETRLYHYDTETKQQSMEWQHSVSPHPKDSECKNPLEKFSPRFFCDQDGILLIDYLPKGQIIKAENYSSLQVKFKGILKKKTSREGHQGGLVLARQCPGSPDTCNPEETGLSVLPVS